MIAAKRLLTVENMYIIQNTVAGLPVDPRHDYKKEIKVYDKKR